MLPGFDVVVPYVFIYPVPMTQVPKILAKPQKICEPRYQPSHISEHTDLSVPVTRVVD